MKMTLLHMKLVLIFVTANSQAKLGRTAAERVSGDARGTIGSKTGKTAVLPWFCKVERGSGAML